MAIKFNLLHLEERIVLDGALAAALIPAITSVVSQADSAHTLYVDANVAGGDQSGGSWQNAYSDMQAALSRATAGDSWNIKVAAGTYTPDSTTGYTFNTGASIFLEGTTSGSSPSTFIDGNGLNAASLMTLNTNRVVIAGFAFIDGAATDPTNAGTQAGALTINDQSTVLLMNTVFTGNHNGAVYVANSDLYVSNSTFTSNNGSTAPGTAGSYGGAITSFATDSDAQAHLLVIKNSVFDSNQAAGGGGAVAASDLARLSIEGSQFHYNATAGNGGAVNVADVGSIWIGSNTFAHNVADGRGGALSAIDNVDGRSSMSLPNNLFLSNSAGSGGALYAAGYLEIAMSQSAFTSNTATTGDGGALDLNLNRTLSFSNDTFTNNISLDGSGGAIHSLDNKDLIVTNSLFIGNSSETGGGAIADIAGRSTTLSGDTFTGNTTDGHGGAVFCVSTITLNINGSVFTNNHADRNGGAVYAYLNDVLNVTTNTFSGNSSLSGGALQATGVLNVAITGNTFGSNSASTGPQLTLKLVDSVYTGLNTLPLSDPNVVTNLGLGNTGLSNSSISFTAVNDSNTVFFDVNNNSSLAQTGGDAAHAISDVEFLAALFKTPGSWDVAFANGVYVLPATTMQVTGGIPPRHASC